MVNGATDSVTDGSSLLADDNAQHIKLFCDADGATVAQAEVGVDIETRGDGQDTAGRQQLVAVGDDGTVVQG